MSQIFSANQNKFSKITRLQSIASFFYHELISFRNMAFLADEQFIERESNNQKLDQPWFTFLPPFPMWGWMTDTDLTLWTRHCVNQRPEWLWCLLCHKIMTIIYMGHDIWGQGNNTKPPHNGRCQLSSGFWGFVRPPIYGYRPSADLFVVL